MSYPAFILAVFILLLSPDPTNMLMALASARAGLLLTLVRRTRRNEHVIRARNQLAMKRPDTSGKQVGFLKVAQPYGAIVAF
jgi:hypothetical protein